VKVYVHAKSKRQINEWLAGTHGVAGYVYEPDGGCTMKPLGELEDGDVVVRYTRMLHGNPVPEAYHVWSAKKKALA
jgi:hypothetical protein